MAPMATLGSEAEEEEEEEALRIAVLELDVGVGEVVRLSNGCSSSGTHDIMST